MDNSRIELKTLRRVPTENNKCEEKEVARSILEVNCPEPRILNAVCDNKTGYSLVSKEQPILEKCICRTQTQQFKIPCSKFHLFILHFIHTILPWITNKIGSMCVLEVILSSLLKIIVRFKHASWNR